MVTLIVNPTVVTLTFTQNEWSTPIVLARDASDTIVAAISVVHSAEGSRLLMRDSTDIIHESEPIDKILDTNHLLGLLELMLNHINLTHRQRIPKSD